MNSAIVDELRHEANAKLNPKKKGALGQFMTPFKIAEFMASLFTKKPTAVLLDAGAGIGSLTIAASKVLNLAQVEAWEVDPVMQSYLQSNLESLAVPFQIHKKDFIHDSIDRIQFETGKKFTQSIGWRCAMLELKL
jgi:predicted RNA methylase